MSIMGKYIFIVEDDLQNRVVFQMALTRKGAFVDFDRWGKDAIYRLQQLPRLDLIVLDLMLPHGISGFDIFDEIRVLPSCADVPVVAVSAMESSIAVPKAQAMGFSGFIAKPIDSRLFPEQLAKIMSGEQVWYTNEMRFNGI